MAAAAEWKSRQDSNNALINGASVCLFANMMVKPDTCLGSNYSLSTNPYGIASAFNVPPGSYQVLIRAQLNKTTTIQLLDTI